MTSPRGLMHHMKRPIHKATMMIAAYPIFSSWRQRPGPNASTSAVARLKSAADHERLVSFGMWRSSQKLWPVCDAINAIRLAGDSVSSGALDLTRHAPEKK